jgi:hypothetical protein
MNYNDTPVDLNPFLNNSVLSRLATVVYQNVFQPIEDRLERFSGRWTRRMVAKRLSHLDTIYGPVT